MLRHNHQFVLFGANDACVPLPTNFQHVPGDKYKANLRRIITHPHIVAHKPKVFLVTPPPLDEIRLAELDLALGHAAATRHAKVSAAYSQTVRELAAEEGVGLVDLWKGVMDAAIAKTQPTRRTNGACLRSMMCRGSRDPPTRRWRRTPAAPERSRRAGSTNAMSSSRSPVHPPGGVPGMSAIPGPPLPPDRRF